MTRIACLQTGSSWFASVLGKKKSLKPSLAGLMHKGVATMTDKPMSKIDLFI